MTPPVLKEWPCAGGEPHLQPCPSSGLRLSKQPRLFLIAPAVEGVPNLPVSKGEDLSRHLSPDLEAAGLKYVDRHSPGGRECKLGWPPGPGDPGIMSLGGWLIKTRADDSTSSFLVNTWELERGRGRTPRRCRCLCPLRVGPRRLDAPQTRGLALRLKLLDKQTASFPGRQGVSRSAVCRALEAAVCPAPAPGRFQSRAAGAQPLRRCGGSGGQRESPGGAALPVRGAPAGGRAVGLLEACPPAAAVRRWQASREDRARAWGLRLRPGVPAAEDLPLGYRPVGPGGKRHGPLSPGGRGKAGPGRAWSSPRGGAGEPSAAERKRRPGRSPAAGTDPGRAGPQAAPWSRGGASPAPRQAPRWAAALPLHPDFRGPRASPDFELP